MPPCSGSPCCSTRTPTWPGRWPVTRRCDGGCSRCWVRARRWRTTWCTCRAAGGCWSVARTTGRRRADCAAPCCSRWVRTRTRASRWPTTRAPRTCCGVAYRDAMLPLAARDVADGADVAHVAAELADLAGATLEGALAVARAEVGEPAGTCRLAVVAMGKCGGRELNYASDVDVVFVAEPRDGCDEPKALRAAASLAATMMRVCSASTAEGTIWPVDAGLRPEGKAGPLVRTLASHVAYYERWAKTWEFQALLKARPVAGDLALGHDYLTAVAPMVWQAADRPDFVSDVQQMRRRVESTLRRRRAIASSSWGRAGLRDVEFAVQLLQLVHGRTDEAVRSPNTLEALEALSTYGYVGRADAAELDGAYRFLRTVEHRLQLHRLRRTHVMPDDDAELRRLGRSLGMRTAPVEELRRRVAPARPRGAPAAREALLPSAALVGRPAGLGRGQADPRGSAGTARGAGLRRPGGRAAPPRGAERGGEPAGGDPADAAAGAARVVRRRARPGRRAAGLPPPQRLAGHDAVVPPAAARRGGGGPAARAAAREQPVRRRPARAGARRGADAGRRRRSWSRDPRRGLGAELSTCWPVTTTRRRRSGLARGVRRRELFRVAAADLLGVVGRRAGGAVPHRRRGGDPAGGAGRVGPVGRGHARGAAADPPGRHRHGPARRSGDVLRQRRRRAVRARPARRGRRARGVGGGARGGGRAAPVAVGALARPAARRRRRAATRGPPGSAGAQPRVVRRLLRALVARLGEPGAAACRPGRRGPGPRARGSRRWPTRCATRRRGWTTSSVREIRRIKARVEAERLPRGADPARHTKLGPGGLADVEWTVQLLQLRHGAAVPGLRTTRTLEALGAAAEAGLLDPEQARTLATAWRTATRVRNAVLLVRGQPDRQPPERCPRALGRRAGPGLPSGRSRNAGRRLPSRDPAGQDGGGRGVLRGDEPAARPARRTAMSCATGSSAGWSSPR